MLRAARARRRRGWWRSAAARSGPSACARRSRRHTVVHLEVEPEDAWRRASGRARPLARDRGRFEQLHARPPRRCTSRWPTPRCRRPTATCCGARSPALRALRGRARTGTRLVWARAASGDYPVFLGPRADRGAASSTRRAGAASWSPTRTWRALQRARGRRADRSSMPGEEHKTLHGAEHVLRALAQAGAERGRPRGGRRRRRGRRPRRLLRGGLPARRCGTSRCRPRWWRRSTRRTAARPAWTCRRARTTWAPTTSRRR